METRKKNPSQTKKDLFFEILRFLIVGAIATLADYAVFYLFRAWLLPANLGGGAWNFFSLAIATAFGFLVGLLINWVLSVSFVFRAVKDKKKVKTKRAFLIFALIGLVGLMVTELGVLLLVRLLPDILLFQRAEFFLPWKEWLAKIVMTCIVLALNYVSRKLLIFRS